MISLPPYQTPIPSIKSKMKRWVSGQLFKTNKGAGARERIMVKRPFTNKIPKFVNLPSNLLTSKKSSTYQLPKIFNLRTFLFNKLTNNEISKTCKLPTSKNRHLPTFQNSQNLPTQNLKNQQTTNFFLWIKGGTVPPLISIYCSPVCLWNNDIVICIPLLVHSSKRLEIS